MKSREIRLTQHFTGAVKSDYFEMADVELPEPGEGEVLVKNAWLSVDPYMRGRMIGVKTYIDPFAVGEPLDEVGVPRVRRPLGVGEARELRDEALEDLAQLVVGDVTLPGSFTVTGSRYQCVMLVSIRPIPATLLAYASC